MKLNPNLSFNLKLYRNVNKRVRYYSLKLHPTLFGNYLLIREFGGLKNKKPTRIIKEYFSYIEDAKNKMQKIINLKLLKGYSNIDIILISNEQALTYLK
jgi:predicted DNA-binding WGR domain protein